MHTAEPKPPVADQADPADEDHGGELADVFRALEDDAADKPATEQEVSKEKP